MRILIIEPYYTGSHQSWADGYQQHSQYEIEVLSLPGRYWKWRMHGGAITLAEKFNQADYQPDLILATDMLDITTFLALTRDKTNGIPTGIYFHENQLTYPWSDKDRDIQAGRDNHYGFINYVSALVADSVFFNSRYHRDSFIGALPNFLKGFPDYNELASIERIGRKSQVLDLGLDLLAFDAFAVTRDPAVPVLLWNHRWEYDKNPKDFFEALYALQNDNIDFKLIVIGENFSQQPEEFEEARVRLADKLLHFGYAETFEEYAQWLLQADIIPVTSYQDFFGGSIVQAMYCGVIPLLPNRLAYPQHIPNDLHDKLIYSDNSELVPKLKALIAEFSQIDRDSLKAHVAGYDWSRMAVAYDQVLAASRLPK
jgi:glycosyltransferase involved in cell wall biosynthesis